MNDGPSPLASYQKPKKVCRFCERQFESHQFQFPRSPGYSCQPCWKRHSAHKKKTARTTRKETQRLRRIRHDRARAMQPDEFHKNGKLKKKWKPQDKEYEKSGRNGCGGSYHERGIVLKKMGFKDYYEYMNSSMWSQVRRSVFARHGSQCSLCPAKAKYIHHNWYGEKDLRGHRLCNMWPVCGRCHEIIHHDNNGKPVQLHEARAMFDRLRATHLIYLDKEEKQAQREEREKRHQPATEEERRIALRRFSWLKFEKGKQLWP